MLEIDCCSLVIHLFQAKLCLLDPVTKIAKGSLDVTELLAQSTLMEVGEYCVPVFDLGSLRAPFFCLRAPLWDKLQE